MIPVIFLHTPPLRIWYLPHHLVINAQKPGKLRPVSKTASKFKGISFNSCLEIGPDLINPMFGLLMRLREKPIALSGDIEGRFLHIGIKEDNQNVPKELSSISIRV